MSANEAKTAVLVQTDIDLKDAPGIEMKVSRRFTYYQLANLLVGALEGGSNYWISQISLEKEPDAGPITWIYDDESWKMYYYPFNPGYSLVIHLLDDSQPTILDPNGKAYAKHKLNLEKIAKGMEIMGTKFPKAMADFINENDDASTADIWLQCCLFGDVIYG